MPLQIQPFRGITYANHAQLSQLTAPPYDVIDGELSKRLMARHPNNAIRLDLNPGVGLDDSPVNEPHQGAKAFMADWLAQGVLSASETPACWAYTQTWEENGNAITRQGVLVAILLDENADPNEPTHNPAQQTILPHERTIHQYIDERIRLYATTATNLSPIFLMGHDGERQLETQLLNRQDLPWATATDDDGVIHKLAKVDNSGDIELIQKTLAPQRLLIADGHHRFQTALTMKRIARQAYAEQHDGQTPPLGALPTDYVLAFVTNMADPGLVVYPTHRVLNHLPGTWTTEQFTQQLHGIFETVDTFDTDDTTIQWCVPGQTPVTFKLPSNHPTLATLAEPLQQLDAAILDTVVFQGLLDSDAVALKQAGMLSFIRDEATIQQQLSEQSIAGVFRLHSPPLPLVKTICESGLLMPQKSTYFYPKLLTGLVFYPYCLPGNDSVLPNSQTIAPEVLTDGLAHL